MKKVTLKLPGREVQAYQVDFEIIAERWSEYKLENGYIMKVRPVLSEVYMIDEKDPLTGKPLVMIKTQNIISLIEASGEDTQK